MFGEEPKDLVRKVYVDGVTVRTITAKSFMDPSTVSRKIRYYLERCL